MCTLTVAAAQHHVLLAWYDMHAVPPFKRIQPPLGLLQMGSVRTWDVRGIRAVSLFTTKPPRSTPLFVLSAHCVMRAFSKLGGC